MKIYYRALLALKQNLIATGRQHQQQPQSAPVQKTAYYDRYTTFSAIQPIAESC